MTPPKKKLRQMMVCHNLEGYVPMDPVELAMRRQVCAILCTAQWWRSWRGTESSTIARDAEKWLDEVAHAVLQSRFFWITKRRDLWTMAQSATGRSTVLQHLVGYPSEPNDDAALQSFLGNPRATIAFELSLKPTCWPDPLRQVSASGEEYTVEQIQRICRSSQVVDTDKFRDALRDIDSMALLCWYFAVLALCRDVKSRGARDWPKDAALRLDDERVHRRAIELVTAAHKGDVTKDTFTTFYTDADDRPQAVDLIWFHVDRAAQQVESVRACVCATLDDVVDRHDLMNPAAADAFISRGPVIETSMSDAAVPADVKAKFVREVAALESAANHEKHWRPDSNQQILELVHPSLYCCVVGRTQRVAKAEDGDTVETLSPADRMYRTMFLPTGVVDTQKRYLRFRCQWIPSEFHVDHDGNVKIMSYINNLHPVHCRDMYESIERIFASFLPLFERVLTSLAPSYGPSPTFRRTTVRESGDWLSTAPAFPDVPPRLQLEPTSPPTYSLRGTTMRVITKVVEIHLTPDKPSYAGGSWHVEGCEDENIVATGIFYIGCENVTVPRLSFRSIVAPIVMGWAEDRWFSALFAVEDQEADEQFLGSVPAAEGRCVVFPNTLERKVEPFELVDPRRPGVSKILVFHVVDPTSPILSTSVIPPQQSAWLEEALRDALGPLSRLPDAVINDSIGPMLCERGRVMTAETALKYRRQTAYERRFSRF